MLNEIENLFSRTETHDATFAEVSFQNICTLENLYAAWRKVRANGGASGIDAVSIKQFEQNLQANLTELSRSLLGETYQPLPVRFVSITKANGKTRELGILTVRDRIAQRAVLDAIEPPIEALMSDCSFAFRPNRNLEMAIREILVSRANGFWWTVEADIENFFPSISCEILLDDLKKIILDGRTRNLIRLWLDAGILSEAWWSKSARKIADANSLVYEAAAESLESLIALRLNDEPEYPDFEADDFTETDKLSPFDAEDAEKRKKRAAAKNLLKEGFWLVMSHRAFLSKLLGAKALGIGGLALAGIALTPKILEACRRRFHPRKGILQGSPISPVLANFYLTDFDKKLTCGENRLIRYCDDFVILCRTETDAVKALETARNELAKRNLALNPEKTRILPPTGEFKFLGYRFLANGLVKPPPSATRETTEKIKQLAAWSRKGMKKTAFQIKKIKIRTWTEYFNIFGKRE